MALRMSPSPHIDMCDIGIPKMLIASILWIMEMTRDPLFRDIVFRSFTRASSMRLFSKRGERKLDAIRINHNMLNKELMIVVLL